MTLWQAVLGDPVKVLRHGTATIKQNHGDKTGEVRPGYQSMGWGSTGFMARQRPGWDRAGDKHIYSIAQAGTGGPRLSSDGASGSLATCCR